MKSMEEISDIFIQAMKEIENDQEEYWNSLTKDQQLMAFCAVARRIYKGEIVDKGSYRYVLYQVFGFDSSAYTQAQDAGYLTIHNSIMTAEHDARLLEAFCKKNKIEGYENMVKEWWL